MENNPIARNYSTISPSARSLLLLKGITNIPYAREAAELLLSPQSYTPDLNSKEISFWGRLIHFENRYWSIDQLLADVTPRNVLEISSGFSFRGLDMVKKIPVHYIDTDLPGIIDTKTAFINALDPDSASRKGRLETLPLNVLDEQQFREVTARFPPGGIVIVNEGLLMYLDTEEKKKLCGIIRSILQERGGYWITADAYVKNRLVNPGMKMRNDRLEKFFREHHVEDNMFNSLEEAAAFFRQEGFEIDKEAVTDRTKLHSLQYLVRNATEEQLAGLAKLKRTQTTWRLKTTG